MHGATVACLAAAILLAACASAKDPIVTAVGGPVGNWRVERHTDRITGRPIANAWLNTRTGSNTNADFPQPAQMGITCFRDREAMIVFELRFRVWFEPQCHSRLWLRRPAGPRTGGTLHVAGEQGHH